MISTQTSVSPFDLNEFEGFIPFFWLGHVVGVCRCMQVLNFVGLLVNSYNLTWHTTDTHSTSSDLTKNPVPAIPTPSVSLTLISTKPLPPPSRCINNPWCTCTARVTVLGLCVCLSVCVYSFFCTTSNKDDGDIYISFTSVSMTAPPLPSFASCNPNA